MNEDKEVDNYRYLWDGSEPGWVLSRLNGQYIDLSLTFSPAGPSNGELMAVRRAVADYKTLPQNQIAARLRGLQSLPIGRFLSDEARIIAAKCRQEQLVVEEKNISTGRYLLTNRLTGKALSIEDTTLANQVVALALQHGVPIVHTEF